MSPPGHTDQALEYALVFAVVGGHASLQQSYAARSQLGCKRVSTPSRTQAGGGQHGIERDFQVAIGAVLEADRAGQAAGHFTVGLALGGTGPRSHSRRSGRPNAGGDVLVQPGRWQQGVLRHHVQVFKCGGGKSWQCLVKTIYKKYGFIPRGIYEDGY
jgi:hypothetical protein